MRGARNDPVKGIAYPIATYVAVRPKRELDRLIRAQLPHLRLEADPARMTLEERASAAAALRVALQQLDGSSDAEVGPRA